MMRRFLYISVLWIAVSCAGTGERENVGEQLLGRTVRLPETEPPTGSGSLQPVACTIAVFGDSSRCERCAWRLEEWALKMKEMKLMHKDVSFLFILQTNDRYLTEHYVAEALPGAAVVFDGQGKFLRENGLPSGTRYHVMLLDGSGRICRVGRPLGDDALWARYRQTIDSLQR